MSGFKQLSRSVKGLSVLVTGAASGMGRATARVFAAEGANVAVTDYAAEDAQAVAAEIAASNSIARFGGDGLTVRPPAWATFAHAAAREAAPRFRTHASS